MLSMRLRTFQDGSVQLLIINEKMIMSLRCPEAGSI